MNGNEPDRPTQPDDNTSPPATSPTITLASIVQLLRAVKERRLREAHQDDEHDASSKAITERKPRPSDRGLSDAPAS